MSFRQPLPALIAKQIAVVPGGRGKAKCPCQQDLPGRRFQQVGAADNFADLHGCIICYHCKLIRRMIVAAPYQEITKVLACDKLLRAKMFIVKGDDLPLGNTKSPVRTGRRLSSGHWRGSGAAGSGIDSFIVVRSLHGLRQVLTRTAARVKPACGKQPAPGIAVKGVSLTLPVWSARTAHIWSLLPVETEPTQVLQHGIAKVRPRPLMVEIFVAENQFAADGKGTLLREPESASVAQVQVSGG